MSFAPVSLQRVAIVPRAGAWRGRFASRELPAEEVEALVAAARVAPSADNLQTWRFVTVRSEETKARLARAVRGDVARAVEHAPLAMVATGVRAMVTRARREQPFVMIDVPIAVVHVLLQAHELGLACAWTLDSDEAAIRDALSIPQDVRVIAVLALGWPA